MEDSSDFAHDWTPAALLARRRGAPPDPPKRVERPGSVSEVAEILHDAERSGTPVVPYGGGSGVVGGIASAGCIVVDTSRLDRIRALDEDSRLVTAEAGVTGPALRDLLASRGLTLGHEPQSIELSTVGGWVSTRACGQLSARYGGIEDMVAGLEAVLPGGHIAASRAAPRRATGPNVADLMIGAEGTLGIVTAATLRIHPSPGERSTIVLRFDATLDGIAACRRIAQSGLNPVVVRLYDDEDAAIFLRAHPDEPVGPLLLVAFEGEDAPARAEAAEAVAGGRRGNGALGEHWWKHRNDAVREFRSVMAGESLLGPHGVVDTMEVAASWATIPHLYARMKEALAVEATFVACHLSHVYVDGACLYFTLGAACADDDAAAEALDRWWSAGMESCLEAGGTISHHHGIGRVRAPWIEQETDGWYEVLRRVKRAIDPKGIMNPGVLGL
ncbi:MAG TPA: FAD-binding oxidoreductase [Actinomycetota bacterium]|nr:FAD-binding oxidoreductase [Actinomycetota bacterium]